MLVNLPQDFQSSARISISREIFNWPWDFQSSPVRFSICKPVYKSLKYYAKLIIKMANRIETDTVLKRWSDSFSIQFIQFGKLRNSVIAELHKYKSEELWNSVMITKILLATCFALVFPYRSWQLSSTQLQINPLAMVASSW